ncbi:MAG: hypothetical protein DRH17_02450 [Deltaproteobacteria bacterium]|nr:MAG: hypothetical protein DRH17_02450 [Deltaproteobacteria bacterium]
MPKQKIIVPYDYDYIGVYLTNKCHLSCLYCITKHHNSPFGNKSMEYLKPEEWIEALNRLVLPEGVPITLQGGEPFLYKGIWNVLENVNHKIDILTSLPPFITKEDFFQLRTLDWNKRNAPYPTIRVSYHKGQNDFKELIERISELQESLSIGLYYLDHPAYPQEEFMEIEKYAKKYGVELRKKEFLGQWNGKHYGSYLYKGAAIGKRKGIGVLCKNTVAPIAPDGAIYRCHSDLYFQRKELALGNIQDDYFEFPKDFLYCDNYGLCNECDVKIKTNHLQIYGYTSVDIKFLNDEISYGAEK